jgi:hypothetical protein
MNENKRILTEQWIGKKVTCVIEGQYIGDAAIQYEDGSYYICQNIKNGAAPFNTLGYSYGWSTDGTESNLSINEVTNLTLLSDNYLAKYSSTVYIDDIVRLVNNKKLPFERNARCKVVNISPSINNKYTIKNSLNSPLDVIYLKNLNTGRVLPTYMKNIKKITNE